MPKDPTTGRFAGVQSPNYTPVPDELFDELAPDLSEAELRVVLYIIRSTFGFKKDSDSISIHPSPGPPLHMFALVPVSDRAARSLAHAIEREQG